MNCKKCGSEIAEGNKFCPNCGTSINEKKKEYKSKYLKIKILIGIVILILVIIIVAFIIRNNSNTDIADNTTNLIDNKNSIDIDTVEDDSLLKPDVTDEMAIIDYIMEIITEKNETEYWEFEPTEEQMNKIIEFYRNNKDTFDSESLWLFINEQGYIGRGSAETIDYSESTTSSSKTNSSQTKSSNSTSSSNKKSNTTKVDDPYKEEVEINLNINLKELIAKNDVAREIKEKYPTIFIHVWVEDTSGGTEQFEYYGGGASLPDMITSQRTLSEGTGYFMGLYELKTFKNRNEKRKVEITMDNTSTAIVRTTLFEGEMVFPKSGTYEIK